MQKTFEKVGAHQHVLVRSDPKRPSSRPAGSEAPEETKSTEVKLLTSKERREAENERSGDFETPEPPVHGIHTFAPQAFD